MDRDLMNALEVLARSDMPTDIVTIALAKRKHAIKAQVDRRINDRAFTAYDEAPTDKEIEPGIPLSASGDGADRAVDHYSRPARQRKLVDSIEALGRMVAGLVADGAETEKAVKRLEKNQVGQLALIGRLAEGINPSLAKSIALLVAKASEDADDDETEEERKKREERGASEKGGQRGETMALLAGMGSGTVGDLMGAMMGGGQRPVAKAALVDAALAAIDSDPLLTANELIAGKSAAAMLKGVAAGAAIPLELVKSRVAALPASVGKYFNGIV